MRELILVEESEQIKGTITDLPITVTKEVVFPSHSTVKIEVDFKFKPVNDQLELYYNCSLTLKFAVSGMVLNAFEVSDQKASLIVSNVTNSDKKIKAGAHIANVYVGVKAMIKAVDYKSGHRVINLNPTETNED